MKVVALSGSPRRDGNSALLAEAVLEGAAAAGHEVSFVHLPDRLDGMLRDCRTCRRPDGSCGIADGHRETFLDEVLPADAIVFATPIWFYGTSAWLKTFVDRIFCYISASYPDAAAVTDQIQHKRLALVLSAEESYLGARLGIEQQVHEMARYLHWSLVGTVAGVGNRRGEVRRDTAAPLAQARTLGERLFEVRVTDYRVDVERSGSVWPLEDAG